MLHLRRAGAAFAPSFAWDRANEGATAAPARLKCDMARSGSNPGKHQPPLTHKRYHLRAWRGWDPSPRGVDGRAAVGHPRTAGGDGVRPGPGLPLDWAAAARPARGGGDGGAGEAGAGWTEAAGELYESGVIPSGPPATEDEAVADAVEEIASARAPPAGHAPGGGGSVTAARSAHASAVGQPALEDRDLGALPLRGGCLPSCGGMPYSSGVEEIDAAHSAPSPRLDHLLKVLGNRLVVLGDGGDLTNDLALHCFDLQRRRGGAASAAGGEYGSATTFQMLRMWP
ncbi:hypothetical protein T492DRAFT_866935 [Pavlovales sp. CCMP2436]|nr:hypothetical protein T492DRAFT_866935 [Pavlovales sp. CCMP2436]